MVILTMTAVAVDVPVALGAPALPALVLAMTVAVPAPKAPAAPEMSVDNLNGKSVATCHIMSTQQLVA